MSGCNRSCYVLFVRLAALLIAFGSLSCSSAVTNKPPAAPAPGKLPEAQGSSQKLALLVGINDYKYVTKLEGTVNDVENMERMEAVDVKTKKVHVYSREELRQLSRKGQ